MKYFLVILTFSLFLFGFRLLEKKDFVLNIPKGFPEMEIPDDNALTADRIRLGKKLFFDKTLSRDSTLSCASCHKPELAFTDGESTSIGKGGKRLLRNSPTLANVGYHNKGLLLDGGVPTLEMQILVPVQEHLEFDFNMYLIAERLKKDKEYVKLCKKAYKSEPNLFVITRAIACFERTLISGNSRYDQYKNGNLKGLNESEIKGMKLFFDKLHCAQCHSGFNFTDLSIRNNGLYELAYPLDSGRMRITHKEIDRDKFKVPTLRNIELTGPYMHDGSLKTLEEVIEHYSKGGKNHSNKDRLIKPFNLSETEKENLISFLKSLTDSSFIENFNEEK